MSFLSRFAVITRGGLRFTGNTLGLSKISNLNRAGLLGSIGAFSARPGISVPTFPDGTTLDYTLNFSSATLSLPVGSTVLYAELVWGGIFRSSTQNIQNLINNPVSFATPAQTVDITPDAATAQQFLYTSAGGATIEYYVRSANVTSLVAAAGAGTYSVGRVPALVDPIDNDTSQTNHAGWTLAVVYENGAEILSYLKLWAGGALVNPDTLQTDIQITDFLTPASGAITARAFMSAGEGDAVISGDQCLFGPDVAGLQPLSGARNPVANFFASQICNETGALDTTGTFGTRNANPQTGTNTTACRQGWDITSVDVSPLMSNGQTQALFRFTTSVDLYIPNALGLKIESLGAFLSTTKSSPQTFVQVGEPISYTVSVTNTGDIPAVNVTLDDVVSPGLELVPNSIKLNGVPVAGTFPVNLPDLAAGQSVIVTYQAFAPVLPTPNPTANHALSQYVYFPFPDTPVNGSQSSPDVNVLIVENQPEVVKSVDRDYAVAGDVITYTSVVTNGGTLTLDGVVFVDDVPVGAQFVAGSVTVDGIPYAAYNPETGFPIGSLAPSASVTVTFKALVL